MIQVIAEAQKNTFNLTYSQLHCSVIADQYAPTQLEVVGSVVFILNLCFLTVILN